MLAHTSAQAHFILLSGDDGSTVWEGEPARRLRSAKLAGDLDADGVAEVVGWHMEEEPPCTEQVCRPSYPQAQLAAWSSAKRATLWAHEGIDGMTTRGIAVVGDHNGDAIDDLAVSAAGVVTLVSEGDGAVLRPLTAPVGATSSLGAFISQIDDLDGDLVPDLVLGDAFGSNDVVVAAQVMYYRAKRALHEEHDVQTQSRATSTI